MSAAGRSAHAEARAIRRRARRGVWRRVTAWAGLNPDAVRADAVAARWTRGAEAEKQTAAMLRGLPKGWHVFHDRQLPGSRANLDHVLVPPNGAAVVVLDTKQWHAAWQTRLTAGGMVVCGLEDRHEQVVKVAGYAERVARAIGVPAAQVWPLLVIHGSQIAGGRLEARVPGWPGPVHVLGPRFLVPTLASAPTGIDRRAAAVLAARVAEVLPPYRP